MIYNYPFFSSPTYRRYTPYTNYVNSRNQYSKEQSSHNSINREPEVEQKRTENRGYRKSAFGNYSHSTAGKKSDYFTTETIKEDPLRNKDKEIFEIFGIKLYFDDILLVGLLFFLYNEGVKDQYLFISLILLLLS